MAENIFESFKNLFKGKEKVSKEGVRIINVREMEKQYEADDLTGAASILIELLEIYGVRKKKNHRLKGREFIHFILSHKHKDLKNIGYTHWQNINKIVHLNHDKAYPYHKENLRSAMDFFRKEIKSINALDIEL